MVPPGNLKNLPTCRTPSRMSIDRACMAACNKHQLGGHTAGEWPRPLKTPRPRPQHPFLPGIYPWFTNSMGVDGSGRGDDDGAVQADGGGQIQRKRNRGSHGSGSRTGQRCKATRWCRPGHSPSPQKLLMAGGKARRSQAVAEGVVAAWPCFAGAPDGRRKRAQISSGGRRKIGPSGI
jgi:hypothetical protein